MVDMTHLVALIFKGRNGGKEKDEHMRKFLVRYRGGDISSETILVPNGCKLAWSREYVTIKDPEGLVIFVAPHDAIQSFVKADVVDAGKEEAD